MHHGGLPEAGPEGLWYRESMPPEQPGREADGVDVTLIRWMLSLSPAERLDALESFLKAFEQVREANAAA